LHTSRWCFPGCGEDLVESVRNKRDGRKNGEMKRVVARHSGKEGPRIVDYISDYISARRPWKVLEDPGRVACHRTYRGLRPINTAYLSAVE